MKQFFILFLLGAALVFQGCGSGQGQSEAFGASELFYKDGITTDEAQQLGKYLLAVGFFDEQTPHTVQLIKRGDTYVFRLMVDEESLKDESFARILRFMSMDISADVFENAPVDVDLMDSNFASQKTIASPSQRSSSGKAIIYRANEVDAATADKVTAYLSKIGFIGDKDITLSYARQGDDFIYEFITEPGAENQAEVVQANKTIAGLLSADVLQNKPVTLHFLAADYSIKKIYPFEEILTAYREFIADSAGAQ